MSDWFDGAMTMLGAILAVLFLLYMTGHLHIYGIGIFGTGRLFCIW